jgi:NADH-quinone oxidoreductase subunit M
MILHVLIVLPVVGGLLAWVAARRDPLWARFISLGTVTICLGLVIDLWVRALNHPVAGRWMQEFRIAWIPRWGIDFHLGLDGLSLLMLALTYFLGIAGVVVSWTEINTRVGFFHFNLLWVLGATAGVFVAINLFLFYLFWELLLVPLYLIIAIWGHDEGRRTYAAIKFVIFTQLGGLFLLLSTLGLAFAHQAATGVLTFDYGELLGTKLSPAVANWLLAGFLIAFLIKLPAVPVHTWLADAHTEAPTAGSVDLAGLLLKTGAYALLRFAVPLLPDAARRVAPFMMALGALAVLYGASVAFGQTDFKRLVAYTSISHMGFVLIGVFAWNQLALQGVVMQMIAHGVSTGALFMLGGYLYERVGTREMARMGGLWSAAPRLGGLVLFFALASLGLPGLGNFVGEFLVLIGSYRVQAPITIAATVGLVAATVYSLWLVQRAFHGENVHHWSIRDLLTRELAFMLVMVGAAVWLGLFPQTVIDTARPALDGLRVLAATMGVGG